jgi:amino acid permease
LPFALKNSLETGIPYAFYRCGFFLAIILLLGVALLVNRSIMYLVSCGLKTRKLDYEALCEHVLGKPGFYVATVAMWMFAYGAYLFAEHQSV